MKKWKKTPARIRASRKNIKLAQAARLRKRTPRSEHLRDLRDIPFTDEDVKLFTTTPPISSWEQRYHEASRMNLSLTKELEHLRRLARLLDFIIAKEKL